MLRAVHLGPSEATVSPLSPTHPLNLPASYAPGRPLRAVWSVPQVSNVPIHSTPLPPPSRWAVHLGPSGVLNLSLAKFSTPFSPQFTPALGRPFRAVRSRTTFHTLLLGPPCSPPFHNFALKISELGRPSHLLPSHSPSSLPSTTLSPGFPRSKEKRGKKNTPHTPTGAGHLGPYLSSHSPAPTLPPLRLSFCPLVFLGRLLVSPLPPGRPPQTDPK